LDVTAVSYKVPGRAHDGPGNQAMSADSSDRRIELEELKARRKLLFKQFVEHPSDVRVSLEIKKIDDQIAELSERMESRKGTKPSKP
jgi:hypothetical protein